MAYESLWDSPSTADVRDIMSKMPARGWTVPGNGVGLVGKALGLFGLDAEGARGRQSWSDAAHQSLWDAAHFPDTMLESAAQAVTAPARAYRGEITDDQMIPEGLNFAGSVALGSAAVPKPNNAAGMFGGRLAKTADHEALARAEKMAADGLPRESIWNETGWFQGPDKKWRFEIDDSGQRLRRPLDELDRMGRPMPSDLVFSHDKLYAAYPQVGDIPWYRTPEMEAGGGSFDPVRGIRIGSTGFASGRSGPGGMTLHEQQHALQDIEGFAKGGSREHGHPIADVKREAQAAYDANRAHQQSGVRTADDELLAELGLEPPALTQEWDSLTPRQQLEWYDAGRGRLYNNLAGEVEARTVQKRMDLTADQRRARPPWLDYDVPEGQQIVRGVSSNPDEAALPGTLLSATSHLDMSPEARMARAPARGWTVPGNGVGLVGKALGLFGLDAEGARGRQSWSDAAQQSLWDAAHFPDTMLESAAQAVTAPARAYRGEIPDDQMIPEGLNFAGSVALGSAAVPKPMGAAAKTAAYTREMPDMVYHASRVPYDGGFDPAKSMHNAAFVAQDPAFAGRFGDSVYPLTMDAGRYFDFRNPQHMAELEQSGVLGELPSPRSARIGDHEVIERGPVRQYLQDAGYDGAWLGSTIQDERWNPAKDFAAVWSPGKLSERFTGSQFFSTPTESAAPGIAMTTAAREQPQDLWNIMPWLPRAALWR